jgi:TRAP-type C4-dicarboxylate transport system permease small subunit
MSKSSPPNPALSGITSVMLYAGLFMLILMTILVVGQVICRNFFDLGLPWADELARFCGVALVFLAAPRLLLDNKHIAVDLVPDMLPRAGRAVLAAVNGLLSLAFSAIILWALYKFLLRGWKFATPALGIPNLVYYLPAILGFVFFAIVTVYRLFNPVSPDKPVRPEPDA